MMDRTALAKSSAKCWDQLSRGLNRVANDNVALLSLPDGTHPDHDMATDFLSVILVDIDRNRSEYASAMADTAMERAKRAMLVF